METDLNFKDFEMKRLPEGDGGEAPQFSFPLSRQASIYSLTFDEFQNTVGGIGKDFGSMNMDEFLKNIWSAEENHPIGSITGGSVQQSCGGAGGGLHRQGSLTISRALSLKTVDEVWQDMLKEYGGGNIDSSGGLVGNSGTQREPTLGEITLEDFLAKASVVRDEAPIAARPNDHPSSNWDFRFENHQENGNGNGNMINAGIAESSNHNAMRIPAKLPFNISFGGQQEPLQLQQLLQSPTVVTSNGQLSSPGGRAGILGITSPKMNNTGIHGTVLPGEGLGIHGLGRNGVGFPTGSPAAVSSDGLKGTDGGMSSVSPTPYIFSGLRGRKMAAVEKVLERRQRRMIKNRESAARSRARKQAYTKELEEEIARLKDENEELQKKQAGMRAMQKNLIQGMTSQQLNGAKRPCLRRTNTGPW